MRMMNPSSFETCFGMGAGVSPFIEGQLIDALKEFDKARARYVPIDLVEVHSPSLANPRNGCGECSG